MQNVNQLRPMQEISAYQGNIVLGAVAGMHQSRGRTISDSRRMADRRLAHQDITSDRFLFMHDVILSRSRSGCPAASPAGGSHGRHR
ncbi:MAG: hypothetical protein J0H99_09275, partial [Rhodospirillales bacterium]|nr:hypothetical protein [Rhodospirillales bacterium]